MELYNLKGKQFKLLEVLINPAFLNKSITDICKKAKISRGTYYTYLKDETFKKALNEARTELIEIAVLPIVNKMIKDAKKGNFQAGKTILEMAGVYTQKLDVDATITIEAPEDIKKNAMV